MVRTGLHILQESFGVGLGHTNNPFWGTNRRGGVPQMSARPVIGHIDLRTPFAFANHDCWQPAFNQPLEQQVALYRDREFRGAFRRDLEQPRIFNGDWSTMKVREG